MDGGRRFGCSLKKLDAGEERAVREGVVRARASISDPRASSRVLQHVDRG